MADGHTKRSRPANQVSLGATFGKWTVIGQREKRGQHWYSLCRCTCGVEKTICHSHLVSGASTGCGCFRMDLTGQVFGRLTVLGLKSRGGGYGATRLYWNCRCECGALTTCLTHALRSGGSKSCGCLNLDRVHERNKTHGKTGSIEYSVWISMKGRCTNPRSDCYDRYGGRGIKVCDRWLNSFENFLADMGPRPSLAYSIDRIDNNGNYEPGNCRWATMKAQGSNKRSNRLLEHNGLAMTISQWTAHLGFGRGLIPNRLKSGWSVERTLTEPAHR